MTTNKTLKRHSGVSQEKMRQILIRYHKTKMHELAKWCKSSLLICPSEHSGYQGRSIMDVTLGPGGQCPSSTFSTEEYLVWLES